MLDHGATTPDLELFDLSGRIAVVVGAAGGLGVPISSGLERAGATVVRADFSSNVNDDAEEGVLFVDVTKSSSIAALREHAISRYDHVDVLVNCAGITTRQAAEDFDESTWDQIINVNLKGTFLSCQIFGRDMLQRRSGSIVNVGSVGSFFGYPLSTAYIQSKGGVAQLTRSLAVEWAPRNVRVNAIAPSLFDTSMASTAELHADTASTSDWLLARTPLGRKGKPEEVVGPVIFLASEASSMVTGHILAVDGGFSAA